MNQEKIGKFIASRRKEKNITQIELASQLGVTNKTVSRWENGHYIPDISLFNDLCNILDIEVTELLNGEKLESDYEKEEIANTMKDLVDLSKSEIKNVRRKYILISSTIILFLILLFTTLWSLSLYYQRFQDSFSKVLVDYKGITNQYFEYQLDDRGLECNIDGNITNPSNIEQLNLECNDKYIKFMKKNKTITIQGLLENRKSNKNIQFTFGDYSGILMTKNTNEGISVYLIYPQDLSNKLYQAVSYDRIYVDGNEEYVNAYFENGVFIEQKPIRVYSRTTNIAVKYIDSLVDQMKEEGFTLVNDNIR